LTVLRPSSLSGFQREMRCVAGRMDARRGAQAMALPLPSAATQQTPSRRTTRRAGRCFGVAQTRRLTKSFKIDRKICRKGTPKGLPAHSRGKPDRLLAACRAFLMSARKSFLAHGKSSKVGPMTRKITEIDPAMPQNRLRSSGLCVWTASATLRRLA